jgi:transposase
VVDIDSEGAGGEVGHGIGASTPRVSWARDPREYPELRYERVYQTSTSPGVLRRHRTPNAEVCMEVLYPRCAGLDVHKDTVVACVRLARGRKVSRTTRTFGTYTGALLSLLEWLQGERVTHVAMEATGVYWKPVWHVLEGFLTLVLANAREIRHVPGRKSDVDDAEWIADLMAHGLIRSSFVPPASIQELRDLTRSRKQLTREHTRHVQRLQKVLEDANIKLDSVVTDIMGVSGRAMIGALCRGEKDPDQIARLADPRLKATHQQLTDALTGRVSEHHRFMLRLHLMQADAIELAMQALDQRIGEKLEPFRDGYERLQAIPGISEIAAAAIIAEVGADMSTFPSSAHIVSWAGLCPRLEESAGKRKSTRTRRQNWIKTMLVQAAWAAVKQKQSYYRALFLRLKSRRGPKKAIVAVAARMLTAAYHILRDGVDYFELGAEFFRKRNREHTKLQLVRHLQRLGYTVQLQAAA